MLAVRIIGVGLGGGGAFVLRPSDMGVEEQVVGCCYSTFELAQVKAPDCFEFE